MQILDPQGIPMMSQKEIEIFDELIEKHKPKTCLEWGSGNSTLYFPNNHECIESWIAIEHKRDYLELLGSKLKNKVAEILIKEDASSYITYPRSLNTKFDLILVDGNYRDECLEEAFKLSKPTSLILLHDSARIESKNMMEKYKDKVLFKTEGELLQPSGFYAHRGLALFKP